jgi:hypothetical protein
VPRNAGRWLLTLADLITVVAPVAEDWNDSHVRNEAWPSHARFHGVVAVGMTTALSLFSIWRLWAPSGDVRAGRAVAAAVPIAYWAPFFLALGVPGTGIEDPPHLQRRVAGVPSPLLGATAPTLTAAAGLLVDRRLRPA